MRLAVDARLLARGVSGVRDVCEGLVRALSDADHQGHELVLFSDLPSPDWDLNVLNDGNFMHRALPSAARAIKADVILIPRQTRPIVSRVRAVPLIHDIGFWRARRNYDRSLAMDAATALALTSRRCLTISEFTKNEIDAIGYRGTATDLPIEAIHNLDWTPDMADPYLLVVGVQAPHKNLVRLVQAFDRAQTEGLRLLIRASSGTRTKDLAKVVADSEKANRIELVGRLEDEEYRRLLSQCSAYIQPSIYEGLCIPLMDLAAAGAPTLASSTGNPGHVFRTAPSGVTFDPLDISDMSAAITRIIQDGSFRQSVRTWNLSNVRVTDWRQVAARASKAFA